MACITIDQSTIHADSENEKPSRRRSRTSFPAIKKNQIPMGNENYPRCCMVVPSNLVWSSGWAYSGILQNGRKGSFLGCVSNASFVSLYVCLCADARNAKSSLVMASWIKNLKLICGRPRFYFRRIKLCTVFIFGYIYKVVTLSARAFHWTNFRSPERSLDVFYGIGSWQKPLTVNFDRSSRVSSHYS